ncbi:DUF1704 domain-containing protein [Candidatus Saccharibacteria bacterium]|nr:DUF1704 domain-containing protein [Candidatus Saccharibacteria bacterium]
MLSYEFISDNNDSIEQLAQHLAEMAPKPADHFMPDNLDDVLERFLSGDSDSIYSATYSSLDSIDFDQKQVDYQELLGQILLNPNVPENHHRAYQDFVAYQLKVYELMRTAVKYRSVSSKTEKEDAKQKYIKLNEELYGAPETAIARSMVKEVINESALIADPKLQHIRNEFEELLPPEITDDWESASLIPKPSQAAKEVVQRIAGILYSPLLDHADRLIAELMKEEDKTVSELRIGPQGIAVIFQTIINREFPDSGWKVVIGPANAIKVNTATKTITMKEDRKPASVEKVRGLVVHELGVHMLRSIIGEGSNLVPLQYGLEKVSQAEEGLAQIMESTISGDDARKGYQHYLTATLLKEGYNFDQVFEVMWRYKALDAYLDKPPEKIDEEFINEQQRAAAKFMFRSIRGSNDLPWYDMLSYFNGTRMWEYIETHKDDPDLVTLMFMGKIDPTNISHLKKALDSHTRFINRAAAG